MSTWSSANLGDALMAQLELGRLEDAFATQYEAAGRPADMALFIRHVSEGQLHCEVHIYFPPAAAGLAVDFDAIPCSAPARADLGLFAGAESAWDAVFPDSV